MDSTALSRRSSISEYRTHYSDLDALTRNNCWREAAGAPRKGSAASKILDSLLDNPVFSAEEVEVRVGGATSSVYAAISKLHETAVIRPLTNRIRNQVWVAASLADELDDLGVRIAARARGKQSGGAST